MIPEQGLFNATDHNPVTDGSAMWILNRCLTDDCFHQELNPLLEFDKVQALPSTNISLAWNSSEPTRELYFLHCNPRLTIEGRHVASTGDGRITVRDAVEGHQTLGNINRTQANLLFSYLIGAFGVDGKSPDAEGAIAEFGPITQATLILDVNTVKNLSSMAFGDLGNYTIPLTMLPVDQIAQAYTSLFRTLAIRPLDGSLGSVNVSMQVVRDVVRLQASLPHLIVSTVLMVFLGIFGIVVHFRKHTPSFAFVDIARALRGSTVPDQLHTSAGEPDLILFRKKRSVKQRRSPSPDDSSFVLALR